MPKKPTSIYETKEILEQYFRYDGKGNIYRINLKRNIPESINPSGTDTGRGYLFVNFRHNGDIVRTYVHRIIYLLTHKIQRIPTGYVIDHYDRNNKNNNHRNLRCITVRNNTLKMRIRKANVVGLKGVTITPAGKYRAQIRSCGKNYHLGVYATAQEANDAYYVGAKKFFGKYARRD